MPMFSVTEDQPVEPATVYVASADHHPVVVDEGLRVTRAPEECRLRPAIDVLFRSASVIHEESYRGGTVWSIG